MKFSKWMLALAAVLSLSLGAWGQEKTEKKAADAATKKMKKAAEAVEEKKAAVEKKAEKKVDAVEKKVAATEKKAAATEKTAEKKAAVKKAAAYTGGMVNINTATKTQLMALPGVGDANADHIIKGRPYKSADELISRKIIQQHYYDDFKQFVTTK